MQTLLIMATAQGRNRDGVRPAKNFWAVTTPDIPQKCPTSVTGGPSRLSWGPRERQRRATGQGN